jgi:hypothetical protein
MMKVFQTGRKLLIPKKIADLLPLTAKESERLNFGVSGLLYKYNRKTESLWSQLLNQAISSPLKSEQNNLFFCGQKKPLEHPVPRASRPSLVGESFDILSKTCYRLLNPLIDDLKHRARYH